MSYRRDAAGALSGIAVFDVLFNGLAIVLEVSDLLFTIAAVMHGTIASEVAWVDESLMTGVLIVVAALYVINLLYKTIREVSDETNA